MQVTITEPDVGPAPDPGTETERGHGRLFGADILALPYYHLVERELEGMRMVISRTGYSGELGYELYLRDASRDGVRLWDAVIQAGEPSASRESALPHSSDRGRDPGPRMRYDDRGKPLRGGVRLPVDGRAEQEQDFIGREALREIAKRGVTRKLVGVELGGAQLGAYSDGSMPDRAPNGCSSRTAPGPDPTPSSARRP